MAELRTGGGLMERLIVEISRGMRGGASLDEIETDVIDPAPLDSDQKAALWMYAWSFQSPSRQRSEALRHLAALKNRRASQGPFD